MTSYRDRAALVASGFVECECGRTRRIPAFESQADRVLSLDLYISGVFGPFTMPKNPTDHLCDPQWLRAQVVELRARVIKRDQKLREMGIGMARLKARGDRSVALPGPFRRRRLDIQAKLHRSFEKVVTEIAPPVTFVANSPDDLISLVCLCCEDGKSEHLENLDNLGRSDGTCCCVEGCPNARR